MLEFEIIIERPDDGLRPEDRPVLVFRYGSYRVCNEIRAYLDDPNRYADFQGDLDQLQRTCTGARRLKDVVTGEALADGPATTEALRRGLMGWEPMHLLWAILVKNRLGPDLRKKSPSALPSGTGPSATAGDAPATAESAAPVPASGSDGA
jgi:hypothetical protein